MRIATAIARLNALPARPKLIAAAIAISVAATSCVLPLLLPPQYTSFALLSYQPPASNLNGSPEPDQQASAILAEKLASQSQSTTQPQFDSSSSQPPDNLPDPALLDPAAARPQISLTKISLTKISLTRTSPTELRLAYTSPSATQAQSTVEGYTALLQSWQTPANAPKRSEEDPQITISPTTPQSADPKQEREQALLRVTIAVLDARIAEFRSSQQQNTRDNDAAQKQITPLLNQRKILLSRLAESHPEASQPGASTSPTHTPSGASASSATTHPFTLLQAPTTAQPSSGFSPGMRISGILTGILLGLCNLSLALWRYRPVQDMASLQKLLPRQALLVGAIGDLHQ